MAAFSKQASLEFELASRNLGDHRLRLSDAAGSLGEETRATIVVNAAPLDEIAPTVEGALAVKIDTQGAEPFVVQGGRKTLKRASFVIMEFWPYGMARMNADPEVVIRYLETQFDRLTISREENVIAADVPVKRAAQDLRRAAAESSGDPFLYFDVSAATERSG